MAYTVPPGVLPAMPKLRWAQAMMAGVEGWIALPDLPANLTLTCARGTHQESMPENIIGALLYVAKPYAAAVENQKQRQMGPERRAAARPARPSASSGSAPSGRTSRASPPRSACA